MRLMASVIVALLVGISVPTAQSRTITVGLFEDAAAEPIETVTAAVSCGPVVFGGALGVQKPSDDDLCYVDIADLLDRQPPGTYRVAVRAVDGTWGERSLPFTVRGPAPVAVPKACVDGGVTYGLGEGPAVERYANDTVARRETWLARERALVAAGFDVKVLLVSTSVYFASTCR